jgi:hypothetical protein
MPVTRRAALALLVALTSLLASAAAVQALPYSKVGEFDEGYLLGVAVDQSSGDAYVAHYVIRGGVDRFRFDSTGQRVEEEHYVIGPEFFQYFGVAVDPENHDLYAYNSGEQEIQTFEPSGALVRHFTVTGGSGGIVQIASDANGDIYYPNQAAKTVQVFPASAKGPTPSPLVTVAPAGEHELVEPRGVASDLAGGRLYVVDSGNGGATPGRVQVFNFSGEWQETLAEDGAQDVTLDPVNGDLYVLALNSEGSCAPQSSPCYRVRAYHRGERTPFEEFGEGSIGGAGSIPDHLAVDHATGVVYVTVFNGKGLIFAPVELPKVSTGVATVSGTTGPTLTATLTGTVNPKGAPTTYHFEYAPSVGEYGTSAMRVPVPDAEAGEGIKEKQVSEAIGPQEQGAIEGSTTYHYRLVATAFGTLVTESPEADHTFTTPPLPPVVAAHAPSSVGHTEATLNGTVNPENQSTLWTFEYGTSPSYTASAPVLAAETTGSAPNTVSAQLPNLSPNTAYHYRLVARDGSCEAPPCEAQSPDQTLLTPPPPPRATTGPSSGVGRSTATISGTVTPGSEGPNSDTTWRFSYGPTEAYGQSAPLAEGDAGTGSGAVPVSAALEGLAPNTTYHYRLAAANNNHDSSSAPQLTEGKDHGFTTLPLEPLAGQGSGLSETAATLEGHANPSGHPLDYRFDYGTSTAYGQSTPLAPAGEGTEYAAVSATLTRLTAGVTYHYRLVVVGAGGETFSPDATFTLSTPAPAQGGNPFAPGPSAAAPFPTFPLLSTPLFPPVTEGGHGPRPLTNAQLLAKALRACAKKPKKKQARCKALARKRYGTTAKRAGRRRR